jgi:hypothetical protein
MSMGRCRKLTLHCRRQRLATVIFAPNRTSDHPDSTELQKIDDLNLLTGNRDTFNRMHHDRTTSHDSARKSWLPVLSMHAEQTLDVDLEGNDTLPKDERESNSSVSSNAFAVQRTKLTDDPATETAKQK